jgi:predicted TIM-barrel fold metal-dependent hydrolase
MRQNVSLQQLRDKLRPPGPVLDVHVHPLPVPTIGPGGTPSEAVDFLIRHADAAGVNRMVLMNLGPSRPIAPKPAEFRAANDVCLKMRDLAPDRFLCFAYVNPAYPDEAKAELDRMIARNTMVGVKLWVAVRCSDPRVIDVVAHAAKLGVPVLQHTWIKASGNQPGESSPADLAVLAKAVPNAKLIMGHLLGGGMRGIEEIRDCPNVYAETAGSDPEQGVVEQAVARLGSRRVIFGSDATGRHMAIQLGKVLGTTLSDTTKKRILWDNLARILPASAGVKILGDDRADAPEDMVMS